jgi:hypothetical protein
MENNIFALDQCKVQLLKNAFNCDQILHFRLRLWVNDIVITNATVDADLLEATFDGYSEVSLPFGDWAFSLVSSDKAQALHALDPFTFTRTVTGSPQTIYGWNLFWEDNALSVFAARLDTPRVMASAGDQTTITLPIDLRTLM